MEESLSKFMNESAKRHEENSNLIKEIRASTDAAIRNQRASIKTLEIQIWQMSKVLQKRGFVSLPSSAETNLRDYVKLILTTVKADTTPICCIGSSQYAISAQHNRKLIFKSRQATIPFPSCLNNYYYDEKGSYGPQYLNSCSIGAIRLEIVKYVFPVDFIILDMLEDVNVPLILERPFLSTAHAKVDVFKRKITLRGGDEWYEIVTKGQKK
ncbi:putative reverse transcriptase domain-containing protein [Tanacetum coccineum]